MPYSYRRVRKRAYVCVYTHTHTSGCVTRARGNDMCDLLRLTRVYAHAHTRDVFAKHSLPRISLNQPRRPPPSLRDRERFSLDHGKRVRENGRYHRRGPVMPSLKYAERYLEKKVWLD